MISNAEVFEDDVFKPTPLRRPHGPTNRCSYEGCNEITGQAISKEGKPLCLNHWLEEHP